MTVAGLDIRDHNDKIYTNLVVQDNGLTARREERVRQLLRMLNFVHFKQKRKVFIESNISLTYQPIRATGF